MKKQGRLITLISVVLLSVLFNVIFFTTMPDGKAQTATFWIAWAFAFPLNILLAVGVYFYTAKKGEELVRMPVVYTISVVAFIVYVIACAVFTYAPMDSVTAVVITESVITVVYALVAMYALFGVEYMLKNQQRVQKKVQFIRLLRADLESCFFLVDDAELSEKLHKLADKIRFSDPMSHEALAACETELSQTVLRIVTAVKAKEYEEAGKLIATADGLLDYRNERCKILK